MALPVMTPEQRAAALEKATRVRTERAELKAKLNSGTLTLTDVLADDGDVAGGIKVLDLLASMPGTGKVRTAHLMEQAGIAGNRKVRGLGQNQRAALQAEFAA